jgi:hypothetical protein
MNSTHARMPVGCSPPLPGAWLVLTGGLWKLPLAVARGWWEALLASHNPEGATVPLRDWGRSPLTPVALVRRSLRLWSGDVAGLAPLLQETLRPEVFILCVEQLYDEGLLSRRDGTAIEEHLFRHISAAGRWL